MRSLTAKHAPLVAILSCSDSRVDPARIFNFSLGQAFVVRNAGNNAGDPSVVGSLEYAVQHLGVNALVVLGHTCCGAVEASYDPEHNPNLRRVMEDLDCARSKVDPRQAKDHDLVAEANVRLQMRRLMDSSPIIRDAVQGGSLELIGAMYHISSGRVSFVE